MGEIDKAVKVTTTCCGDKVLDISPILADPKLFKEAENDMYQMYEREVFDIILTTKLSGTIFASTVASKVGRGMVVFTCIGKDKEGYIKKEIDGSHSKLTIGASENAIKGASKAVVIVDELTHGRDVKAAIEMAESLGVKVIKISSFVEDSAINARKTVLKGYPLESRLFTEDY